MFNIYEKYNNDKIRDSHNTVKDQQHIAKIYMLN